MIYNVSFGDNETLYSCSCQDFRRTRLLCKHFFAIIKSGRKQFSDLTKLFPNHRFTNLDRGLFKDNEIYNVADPTLVKDKWKKFEEKIEEKHIPDTMDLSDLENASGFFSVSYSGSDTFLFAGNCVNLVNYRKTKRKHWSFSDLRRYELFLVFLFFLQSLKLLWDYKTADNFIFLSVSFKRPYERKEILSNDNYTLNYQKRHY